MVVQNFVVDALAYTTINYNNELENPPSASQSFSIWSMAYNIISYATIQKPWHKNKIPWSYGGAKISGGRIQICNNQFNNQQGNYSSASQNFSIRPIAYNINSYLTIQIAWHEKKIPSLSGGIKCLGGRI